MWLTVILVVRAAVLPSSRCSSMRLSCVSLMRSVTAPRWAMARMLSVTSLALSGFTRAMRATAREEQDKARAFSG